MERWWIQGVCCPRAKSGNIAESRKDGVKTVMQQQIQDVPLYKSLFLPVGHYWIRKMEEEQKQVARGGEKRLGNHKLPKPKMEKRIKEVSKL